MSPSPNIAGDGGISLNRLALRHDLSKDQIAQLTAVLARLAEDGHAPTTVRDPGQASEVHLADSLVALELELVREATRIADIGAGAGFPGLPLAIALPQVKVGLIESQARKCAFIESVCSAARIENAKVVCARAEEWLEGIGGHDVVLARAVAAQPIVLEYAAPLLRLGGALVDWRGRRDSKGEQLAGEAAELLGMRLGSITRVEPYAGVRDHHLHIYVKVRATPERFPRRVGMASKRPLAA
jgi:16S rRNA (guanine527-N7)-methyltransferase